MKKNILFIADGSLRNPILQSQGFPLLSNLDQTKYKPFVLSFEETQMSKEEGIELKSIIIKYNSKINFISVTIPKKGIVPSLFYFTWKRSIILYSIIRKYDIELLHARSFYPAFLSVIIKFFFKPSVKVIYDNRGLFIDELIFNNILSTGDLKEKIFRTIEKIIINKCDKMIVVSNKFKVHATKEFGKEIEKKIYVIANRTTLKEFPNYKSLLELKSESQLIGVFSGSAASWQNLSSLFRLFKDIINIDSKFLFEIFSYQIQEFKKVYEKNKNLMDKIKFSTYSSEEVYYNLMRCNFAILIRSNSIVNTVSSPLKFAEYLAAGLPIMISEGVGDTENIIIKNNVGVIIKNNNFINAGYEMRELLHDTDVYNRCRRVAETEFDIQDTFKDYLNVYSKIIY